MLKIRLQDKRDFLFKQFLFQRDNLSTSKFKSLTFKNQVVV